MTFLSLYQALPTLTVIVFFLLIVGIALYFSYAYKKEAELSEKEKQTLKDYEKILTQAHKEARKVVEKASKKAQKILSQTSDFDREALLALTKNLQQETSNLVTYYHTTLTQTAQGESEALASAASEMERLTEKEIQAYSQNLQQTLVVSQDKIAQEISQDLAKAKEEIEKYKDEQLTKAHADIDSLVNKVAMSVLGKAISLEDHEKLILDSLEAAKKEGLFAV